MKLPMNFHSAELHISSLAQSTIDSVAQAIGSAEHVLAKLEDAVAFSHELARFVNSVKEAIAGEIPITVNDDSAEQRALRVAAAAKQSTVTPIRTLAAELRDFNPNGAA